MSGKESVRDPTLSRAYRQGATGEPPAALDALILAAARKEAATSPRRAPAPWWRRALAPAGLLATLVVAVSVVLRVEQEQRDQLPAAAPAPAPAVAPAAPAMSEAAKPMEPGAAKAAAVPPPAARAPAKSVAAMEGPPAAAPEPQAVAPMPATAVPAGPADNLKRERQAEPPSAVGGTVMEQKIAPMPAPAAAPAAAARRDLNAADTQAVGRAPGQWLEEIRQLRRAGQEAEAQAQLAAFRRAYPDYPLPDDLKQR